MLTSPTSKVLPRLVRGGGCRLLSGSATVAQQATGTHLRRIQGYSLLDGAFGAGEAIRSSPFHVGGREWRLLLYPGGIDSKHRGFLSVDQELADDSSYYEQATASYRVSVLDYAGGPAHSRAFGPCRFGGRYRPHGHVGYRPPFMEEDEEEGARKGTCVGELVAAEELRRAAPFLVRNDCLNVRCDVAVLETETKSQNWWFMRFDRALKGFSY